MIVALFSVVNPPVTHTIWSEWRRLGKVERDWVPIEEISPVMARAVVAAEDANFCLHWGFDVDAIRDALEDGGSRGASTITQQVVKNVFLWQGRSWVRKALETSITPVVEIFWSKQRILEVYLNVAETGQGVFGVEAAAQRNFNVSAAQLSPYPGRAHCRDSAISAQSVGHRPLGSDPQAGSCNPGWGGHHPRRWSRGLFRGLKPDTPQG